MKKIILSAILSLLALPCLAEPFMDKALSSWVGYPLDAILKSWGYPDNEQTIAGKKVYVWEDKSTYQDSTYERSYVKTDKKGRTYVDTYTSGGGTTEYYCKKFIEVNSDNMITGYTYKGNSCPGAYYFVGRKLVNPDNDEWKQKKEAKKAK